MKKIGILNSDISAVISNMGHTDSLVIGDAGLPIPLEVERIDLAVSRNIPRFMQVVKAVAKELQVEEIIVAEEMEKVSPQVKKGLLKVFPNAKVTEVPHEDFKLLTFDAHAIVRTGEFTPYANVILKSGVVF